MNITNLSILELKALAYDTMAQMSALQNNLVAVNDLIAQKSKEVPKEEVKPAEDVVEASGL